MDEELARKIEKLITNITQNFEDRSDYLGDCDASIKAVRQLFDHYHIQWWPPIEQDVSRILNGNDPVYFIKDDEYADSYRSRRKIVVLPPASKGTRHISEVGREAREQIDCGQIQAQIFGISLHSYGSGDACYAELQEFYASSEWQRKAEVTHYLGNHKCAACQRTDIVLGVFHEKPIISAYHDKFWKNFSDDNLRLVCEDCYGKFHSTTVHDHKRFYTQTDTMERIEDNHALTLLKKAHDTVKLCPHCYGYQPGWDDMYAKWKPDIDA